MGWTSQIRALQAQPGYGRRDPRADDALPRERWESGRLRIRPLLTIWAGLSCAFWLVWAGLFLGASVLRLRSPSDGLVAFGLPAFMTVLLAWYALTPVVEWDAEKIVFRSRPLWPGVAVRPEDVVWRHDATYVGRFLIAKPEGQATVRFPLWLVSRSGAKRLFAFLDHVAPGAPAGSPPTNPTSR